MPTSDGKVVITVDSNARQAATDFNTLDQSLKNVEKDGQQVAAGSNKMFGALGSLKGAVVAAGVAFAGMKLAQFGQQIFQVSSQFEQLNVAFGVLAGQTAGQQLVKDLTDLANVTPMTTQGLADNARLLLSFGEASQNVITDLKLLGDISGGNQQKMDMLTLAFAQAGSAGRLMGQDLLQMVNAGFNPLQVISEKTGKSMFELRKEMEQGKISFDMIKQAMIDATSEGGRFYGMMNKQSQTLEGRLSTLADKWSLVAKNIGDFFLPVAKAAVNVFIRLGDSVLYIQNQLAKLDHPLQRAYIGLQKFFGLQKQSSLVFTMKSNISTESEKATQSVQKLTTGFRSSAAAVESVTRAHRANHAVHKQAVTEQINDYQKLQNKVSELRNNLMIMATQGKNSGDLWTKSLQNYQNAQAKLDAVNKSIETNATTQIGSYDALNNKITELRNNLQNMAVAGEAGTPAFDAMKNEYVEATNQMENANTQVANAAGVDWKNIASSIKTNLASALTTPLQEGETAFQRLGNVAMNIISMIAQAMLEKLVISPFIDALSGSGIGKGISGFFGGLFKNAKGNAFENGQVKAFANGGIVSSPTLFPMKNGTGLMGEAGAEAIMPLKRTSNGRLGVEATGQTSPQINIYNQSQSQIETVTRPNGETDLFIRKVNNALASERTQSGLTKGMSRQNSRGITAA